MCGQGPKKIGSEPPDRTRLAKRNAGIFSVNRLYEAIEGAKVLSHGSRDMPIGGTTDRLQAGEYSGESPYDPVACVRPRILALVDYLNRLQEP